MPAHSASATHARPTYVHAHMQPLAFNALLDETRAIVASADFAHVLEVCLDRATEVLSASLERNVFVDSDLGEGLGLGGGAVRIRLAGLLPGLARWSQLAMRGLPNELVDVGFFFFLIRISLEY